MTVPYSKRMQGYGSDFIKEMFAAARNPDLISFAGGAPAPELYPLDAFRAASDKAFEEWGRTVMAYDGAEGIMPLREIIANERMPQMGVNVGPEDIRILSGSQQGIDFAARLFIDEGDTIICEYPTYLGALNSFGAFKPSYVSVPMDNQGMLMEELEKTLIANPQAKLLYTVPEFQNPTGITLAADRRKRMVELAEEHDILIIEDSPYYEIRFEGENIPAIKSFDTTGDRVIYLGSFSKTLCPGIRLGWACANFEILDRYRVMKEASDFQASTVTQYQVATFLRDNPLDELLNESRRVYRGRRDAALAAIEEFFPDNVEYTIPQGGYFIWLTVPGVNATEMFLPAVNDIGVAYVPGESFFAAADQSCNFRLSYSQMTEEKIREGISRLAKLLSSA
ncbi:MAG: aminotransferase class I/II-fold pyridoxal phosphate-dependent enzyme [Haliea sp.]|jgi:2-aminoadipate transaminase|nr:aminotransferase class I/II-fold pyridoxal phosphate-dependent enzyme [Haliea sp.]